MASTNGHADLLEDPVLMALESWKAAGVLDAPQRVDALSKSLRAVSDQQKAVVAENAELSRVCKDVARFNRQLQDDLAATREKSATLERDLAELRGTVKAMSSRPDSQGGMTLNLLASGLAEQLGEVLSKSVVDVIDKTLAQAISAPVANITIDTEALGRSIVEGQAAVLRSISERPEPQAPIVDVAATQVHVDMLPVAVALEKSIGGMVAQMSQPAAQVQVTVDTEGIADAVGKAIGKSMERFAERMQPQDLAPVLKRIDEGNAAVQKALTERNRPKQKRIGHDPDTGDLIVTEE